MNVRIARCRWFDSEYWTVIVGSSSNVQGELAVCQISSASGLDIAVEVAVAGASAPYRWVGIARQDCSYEPEPLWSGDPWQQHHLDDLTVHILLGVSRRGRLDGCGTCATDLGCYGSVCLVDPTSAGDVFAVTAFLVSCH